MSLTHCTINGLILENYIVITLYEYIFYFYIPSFYIFTIVYIVNTVINYIVNKTIFYFTP